ncbi:MAG: hypothetical protein ABGY71_15650 [bacterium]|nr:hypothetical protein [Planctomycetota bacterium]HIL52502.1 hypothetical protein [Planctomycetota bacterium]
MSFRPATLLLVALCGAREVLSFQATAPEASAKQERDQADRTTDEQALKAWQALDEDQKLEVMEWFRAEVVYLPTFQNQLLAHILDNQTEDPGFWPAAEAAPWFDPRTHAPLQPIPRKPLKAGSRALEKKRAEFFFRVPKRRLASGWVYDYVTGELRRSAPANDIERLFANALAGFAPNHDLAEALVEQQLDRAEERPCLTAFAHAYTDRSGRVYSGLTLYDAWASGANMEMPDIDTLGILHTLTGDWKTYKAPVPGRLQRELYDRVADLFLPAQRYRGLRHALAMTYLCGRPKLRDGYSANLDRLHSLWERAASTPSTLRESLPDAKGWQKFLEDLVEEVAGDAKFAEQGLNRRDTLLRDGLWVRKKLIETLIASGHL